MKKYLRGVALFFMFAISFQMNALAETSTTPTTDSVQQMLEKSKAQTTIDNSISTGTKLVDKTYAEQAKSDKEKSEAYLKSRDSSIFFRVFGLLLTIVGLSRLFYVMVEAVTDCNRKALFLSYFMAWLIGYFFSLVTELQRAVIEREAGVLIQFMWVVLAITFISQIISIICFDDPTHSGLINSRSSVAYHVEILPDGRHRTVQTVSETMVNVSDSQNGITRSRPMPGSELFNEFRSMAEAVAVEREQTTAQPEPEPGIRESENSDTNASNDQVNGNEGFIRKISLD